MNQHLRVGLWARACSNPQPITTTGTFQLLPAKFGNGALIDQPDQTVSCQLIPIVDRKKVPSGLDSPDWNGFDNNSTINFTITQDGYAIDPVLVFIGAAEYHPTITNGAFSISKESNVGGTPDTKDGVFIYYDKDISGSFSRWYVRTIDGYVEPSHTHSAFRFFIQTTGTIYDNKLTAFPKPVGVSYFHRN